MKALRGSKGQALIEYTVILALITMVMLTAIATVSDEVLDIWNDLAEDLDTIDDYVADTDLGDTVEMPESDEDGDSGDWGIEGYPW